MFAGGLSQQKRNSGVFEHSIQGVPPHDVRHLMAKHEPNLVPLSLAQFQQWPTHEDGSAWQGKGVRFPLRRDVESKRKLLLLYACRQPGPNLRGKFRGDILLNQGYSRQESRRQVAAQAYLGAQGLLLRSAHEVEGVL